MSVSFTSFTQIAQSVGNDSQKITKGGAGLREGSTLGFFKFSAKKAENLETSKAFVASIKSHPVFKSYLPAVADITRGLETSTKPLTARTIKAVERALTVALTTQQDKNVQAARNLRKEVGIPVNAAIALRKHCDTHNIDMASMDPKKAFEIMKSSLTTELIRTMPHLSQEVKEGLRRGPFMVDTLKALIPAGCDSLEKLQGDMISSLRQNLAPYLSIMENMGLACYNLNSEGVQKAVHLLVDNAGRGLVADADVSRAVVAISDVDSDGQGFVEGASTASTSGCEKALMAFMAAEPAVTTMAHILRDNGLPESFAAPLAHHPKLLADLAPALANVDFQSATLQADINSVLQEKGEAFIANNKTELLHIVEQFKAQGTPEATQTAIINGVLGTSAFMSRVLVSDGIMKPEAFAASLKDFTNSIHSCTHGVSGAFGGDDKAKITGAVTDFFLKQTGVDKIDALKNFHDQLAPLTQNMSLLMNNPSNFGYNGAFHSAFMAQYSALTKILLVLQPYSSEREEASSVILFDSKTQKQIAEDFMSVKQGTNAQGRQTSIPLVEAGNPQLDPLTIAVGKTFNMNPALFGSQDSHDRRSFHTVMNLLFDGVVDRDVLSAAPNAQLAAFINVQKAACGLGDRDGLTVDAAKINRDTLYRAASAACQAYTSQTEDIVTVEDLTTVAHEAIKQELSSMGEAMTAISQNPTIAAGHKQDMLNMVLDTPIRTASDLEAVYGATLGRSATQGQSLMEKLVTVLENPLALEETLPLFMLNDFAAATHSMRMPASDSHAEAVGWGRRMHGVANIMANSHSLNDAQRTALHKAVGSAHMRQVGSFLLDMHTEVRDMLANPERLASFPKGAQERLTAKKDACDSTSANIPNLYSHLSARLAKDSNNPAPWIAHGFYNGLPVKSKNQLSRAELASCTAGLEREAQSLVSPLDSLLADKSPKLSLLTFRVANSVMDRMQGAPHYGTLLEQVIAQSAGKLVAASDNGKKELSPREIYTTLTGKRAPLWLTEGNMATKIHDAIVNSYKKMGATLSPVTIQNTDFLLAFVITAQARGISAEDMAAVLKGDRLTLASVEAQSLTMVGFPSYNESNAFGLVTDYRRMGHDSAVSFTNAQGAVTRFTAHPEITDQDNVPTNPIFQDIMRTAGTMAQTPKQKAVMLQAISQASTAFFRLMGVAFAQNVSEHGNFTFDLTQKADNSVDVHITMAPQAGFNGSVTLNIAPNGNTTPTAFDFGLASRPRR